MIKDKEQTVDVEKDGLRLDRFIAGAFPSTTRALAVSAIEGGGILVNDRPAEKGHKLAFGDRVTVKTLAETSDVRVAPNPAIVLTVLHEDNTLIVFDKPAGIPVHPLDHTETGTLANGLVARWPELAEIGADRLFPAFVHRLDTDTSGLLVAAKTGEAYDAMREMFSGRKITKKYLALVHGDFEREGETVQHLAHSPRKKGRMVVVGESRPPGDGSKAYKAVSNFTVLKRWRTYTLVEVEMLTGITHQIRCQLAALGHPVAGDAVYGSSAGETDLGLTRHFLHAARLEFQHPALKSHVVFESPLPADLQAAVKRAGGGRETPYKA